LKKIIKEVNPDIVHATTYHAAMPACLVSHLYKKPIVLSVLSLFLKEWFHHFNPIYSSFYYLFERLVFSFPYDKIIALDYAAYYNLCGLGLKKKSIVNEHHIDTELFKPKDRKKNNDMIYSTSWHIILHLYVLQCRVYRLKFFSRALDRRVFSAVRVWHM